MTTYCPSPDHDGAKVPATRHIEIAPADAPTERDRYLMTTETMRCESCVEIVVAVMVRNGQRVTIWATEPLEQESER
ncbi:hypothetical protein [Gryllotalpicola koreensis]|uniref:Uncharacterized protein n=1 Tax=Gryllotalpicola koreensis TaxID=993086 RepID=A0ABP8A6G8_9MICO